MLPPESRSSCLSINPTLPASSPPDAISPRPRVADTITFLDDSPVSKKKESSIDSLIQWGVDFAWVCARDVGCVPGSVRNGEICRSDLKSTRSTPSTEAADTLRIKYCGAVGC